MKRLVFAIPIGVLIIVVVPLLIVSAQPVEEGESYCKDSLGGRRCELNLQEASDPGGAQLSIMKRDRQDPWYITWRLGYDIYITNTGTVTLNNVVITDNIPSPWMYLIGEDAGLPYKVWTVEKLAVGESRHFEIEMRSKSNTPPGTVITNVVEGIALELSVPAVCTETTLLLAPLPQPTNTPTSTPTATPTIPAPTPTITPTVPPPTRVPTGDIVGLVWSDDNGDGEPDIGERGIEGVRIELWAASGDLLLRAALPERFTYTDSDGRYRFEDVRTGDYIIQEIDPEGYESTTDNEVAVAVVGGETIEVNFGDRLIGHKAFLPLVSCMAE